MEGLGNILIVSQLIFTISAIIYFYSSMKSQHGTKRTSVADSGKETERLRNLRSIHLTEPLAEKTRPCSFDEIIGQEKGIRALKAALCGHNPQHVIIYGPPGVGKTAAARLVLEEAKKNSSSPFKSGAKFIEIDATILQFDERSIADPLIGSVHDPIYQGAGAYGSAGIPQPKEGAVTKAHGGILFIDEIGELKGVQMNKLLKVLEDRKVFLSSSYYSEHDKNIPKYIHDIFKNGLPADFRLVGATTRTPEEMPPALRSRCTEIYFRSLKKDEVLKIAANSCKKAGFKYENEACELAAKYSSNGRDTVNIIQAAAGIASISGRKKIEIKDAEEVIEYGRYSPRIEHKIGRNAKTGTVNGLAVYGSGNGVVLEIEAVAEKAAEKGTGNIIITGIIEEEEISSPNGNMRRKGTARSSAENVLTVIGKITEIDFRDYNIHINFMGGFPVDGPSAGIAMFTAVYSALFDKPVSPLVAMTGEISIKGLVKPVGGVSDKIEAALNAGAEKVIIPKENWQNIYEKYNIEIIKAKTITDVIEEVFGTKENCLKNESLSA